MKRLFILIFTILAQQVHSQDIVQVEYFVDTDPGFGNGTEVSFASGADVDLNFDVDLSDPSMSNGFHILFVRAKDSDGKWSLTFTRAFLKEALTSNSFPDITKVEYFVDEDPGFGNGTDVPVTPASDLNETFTAVVSSLNGGHHILFVRARDENGLWSLSHTKPFLVEGNSAANVPNITAIEYYFSMVYDGGGDGDSSGPVRFTGFTPSDNIDIIFNIDLSDLISGTFNLHIAGIDENDQRSLEHIHEFDFVQELLVSTKVFLEGPYNSSTDLMSTALKDGGNIPLTSPYSEDPRSVVGIPQDIVDWVLVELREGGVMEATTTAVSKSAKNGHHIHKAGGLSQTVASKSAFLHEDGRIVADDGTTGQIILTVTGGSIGMSSSSPQENIRSAVAGKQLSVTENVISKKGASKKAEQLTMGQQTTQALTQGYHIVIKQRNHLAIMSANPVALSSSSSTLYDFTTSQSQAFNQGANPMKELDTGKFGMLSGDGTGDGGVDAFDRNQVWIPENGTTWAYTKLGDFNLDGGIDALDVNVYWIPNNGTATQVPEEPPTAVLSKHTNKFPQK